MSEINDGGPAFPIPLQNGQSWQSMAPCDGMTLRDYFAAKAMQGFCTTLDQISGEPFWNVLASDAYKMTDAMLVARSAT